jgi:hypothetical protein
MTVAVALPAPMGERVITGFQTPSRTASLDEQFACDVRNWLGVPRSRAQIDAHPRRFVSDESDRIVRAAIGRVGEMLVGFVILNGLRDLDAIDPRAEEPVRIELNRHSLQTAHKGQ